MEPDRRGEPITLTYASNRSRAHPGPAPSILGASVAFIVLSLVIASFIIPRSGHGPGPACVHLTKAQMGSLTTPLELFRQAMGRYPKNLKELYEMPASDPDAHKWAGPYIDTTDKLKDAWGRTLCYKASGPHNSKAYDLWSMGKDGLPGTSDDVCNW